MSTEDTVPAPTVHDLEAPQPDAPFTSPLSRGNLHRLTPRQLVFFYPPNEWETFVREWATTLGPYNSLKVLAGPGDKGIDVAGLVTPAGLLGEWDCFQCKHYENALMPSDAFPEIVKLFKHVEAGHYTLPRRYSFVAPMGCGPSLNSWLSNAPKLKEEFLGYLDRQVDGGRLSSGSAAIARRQAENANFELFRSEQLEDILEAHAKTPYFVERFDQPLPPRPPTQVPIAFIPSKESRYAAKLINVYLELDPACDISEETASSHPKYGTHMKRQREAFFSAEALREFARDKVPPGTFELLQEDVFSGVIDVAEGQHLNGMERLRSVLTQASVIDLTAHRLVTQTRIPDRHGMCHQLASLDRLDWVQ